MENVICALFIPEELVEQIRENPYYQYFISLPGKSPVSNKRGCRTFH